jgi:hypothetical protein
MSTIRRIVMMVLTIPAASRRTLAVICNADIDDHGLHCIKTESNIWLGITDVNTPTKTETDNMVLFNNANMGNHALACIKTEYATIAAMDEHEIALY